MSHDPQTTEQEDAIKIANMVLDDPSRDPDSDLSMMSRQFLRKLEQRDYLIKVLQRLARLGNEPLIGNSNGNVIAVEALKYMGIEP